MSEDEISFYPSIDVSSAFGEFIFGVSPFGTVPILNWRDTVVTQYANSPILLHLIESWFQSIDQEQDIDSFFDLIWNVMTAQGYGLDIWGTIVGVDRNLEVADPEEAFGFSQGETWDTFGPAGTAPFYTGASLTNIFTLTDTAYRQLILAKALANICDGSIPSINAILLALFGPSNPFGPGGNCYVTNGQDMTMTFTFEFTLNPVQNSIIYNADVLPVPSGVVISIVVP